MTRAAPDRRFHWQAGLLAFGLVWASLAGLAATLPPPAGWHAGLQIFFPALIGSVDVCIDAGAPTAPRYGRERVYKGTLTLGQDRAIFHPDDERLSPVYGHWWFIADDNVWNAMPADVVRRRAEAGDGFIGFFEVVFRGRRTQTPGYYGIPCYYGAQVEAHELLAVRRLPSAIE